MMDELIVKLFLFCTITCCFILLLCDGYDVCCGNLLFILKIKFVVAMVVCTT